VGKLLEDPHSKLMVVWPVIAEITSPVDKKDRRFLDIAISVGRVVIDIVIAHSRGGETSGNKVQLSQQYGAIADVRMPGGVDNANVFALLVQEGLKDLLDPIIQVVRQRF
jgi:hypothetical protein